MAVSEELPCEILCQIFELLCDEPIALHILQNTSRSELKNFPWAAGLVCKRWRTVFLSYPHFWTSFFLQDGPFTFDDKYVAEMNRRMAMYIERSEQLPLSVVVHVCHRHTLRNNTSRQALSTWRILLSLSHRWKTVKLMAETPSKPFVHDLGTRRGKIPILESLTVSTHGSTRLPLDAFEIAPRLAEVELKYLDGINFEVLPLSPLKSITIVSRPNIWSEIDRMHSILPALRNVEELRLIGFITNHVIPEIVPVHLDRLRFLQVLHPDALSWIEAPSLEHLHIEDRFSYTKRAPYTERLLYFVQNSSCRIRQLTLQCCDFSTAFSIMEILTHVNKLSIIDDSVDYSGAVIKAIAKFDIYSPNLRVLEVTCYPRSATKTVVNAIFPLLEMWNSKSGIIPLEKVVIHLKWLFYDRECLNLDEVKEVNWPSFVDVEVVLPISSSSRLGAVTINIFLAQRHRFASQNAMDEA
ncbi:hypothetical protein F5887DRAFT_1013494 [Amanita rubescens]|nr:hypothetical protein F5887DRAFT_1013494 [Amanita rubescens]